MFMARVVGTVWSTVKWDDLEGLKLLLVRPYHLDELSGAPAPGELHDGVVAADILGAGVGEDVVVAYGHSARVGIEPHLPANTPPARPIDAAVVAIVDRFQVEPDKGAVR